MFSHPDIADRYLKKCANLQTGPARESLNCRQDPSRLLSAITLVSLRRPPVKPFGAFFIQLAETFQVSSPKMLPSSFTQECRFALMILWLIVYLGAFCFDSKCKRDSLTSVPASIACQFVRCVAVTARSQQGVFQASGLMGKEVKTFGGTEIHKGKMPRRFHWERHRETQTRTTAPGALGP